MTHKEFQEKICEAALPYYRSDSHDDFVGTSLLDNQETIIRNMISQCEFVQCLSEGDDFTDQMKEKLIYGFIESLVRQLKVMSVVNDQIHSQTSNLLKRPVN